MDTLKTGLSKSGKRRKHKSRVRQFYSDFNSSDSSNDDDRASPFWETGSASPDVFTFDHTPKRNSGAAAAHRRSRSVPRAPRTNEAKLVPVPLDDNSLNGHNGESKEDESLSSSVSDLVLSPGAMPLVSPGLSRNQDMKDKALALIYQKKIKDLRSTWIFSSAVKCFF